MRRLTYTLLAAVLGLSLSGCFIVHSHSHPAHSSRYKNHGQERKAEVHQRNAERKSAKDKNKHD
jgi:hypothetical protein